MRSSLSEANDYEHQLPLALIPTKQRMKEVKENAVAVEIINVDEMRYYWQEELGTTRIIPKNYSGSSLSKVLGLKVHRHR